jgi:membrane protein YqaA with SNARE-associated domain
MDLVPLAGIEPALLAELDFESSASTNSATGAMPWQVSCEGKCGQSAAVGSRAAAHAGPRHARRLVLKGSRPARGRSNWPSSMLRRLYDWTLALAARRSAPYALGVVSFAESSFFPVPPDVMLVPMCLAKPERAWSYAAICTITSVLGGLLGYAIGALLYDSIGAWLFRVYGLTEGAETFRASYAEYGHWIILLKGLTPIPYKLVTITSGFASYDLFWFVVLSIVTRGARFFALALLLSRFGPFIRGILDQHFNAVAAAGVVALVGGFAAFRYLF